MASNTEGISALRKAEEEASRAVDAARASRVQRMKQARARTAPFSNAVHYPPALILWPGQHRRANAYSLLERARGQSSPPPAAESARCVYG